MHKPSRHDGDARRGLKGNWPSKKASSGKPGMPAVNMKKGSGKSYRAAWNRRVKS